MINDVDAKSSWSRWSASLEPLRTAGQRGRPVTVAVLDGRPDLRHPCFEGASIRVAPPLGHAAQRPGAVAHGTHLLSLIVGQPGTTVEGVAPRASVVVIPIYGEDDGRLRPCSQLDIARGIDAAVSHGAEIIMVAGGQPSSADAVDPLLGNAIERAAQGGAVIVAAAGNDGLARVHAPAVAPRVLAVGAIDHDGVPLPMSNHGPEYGLDAVVAPGRSIPGATAGGDGVELQTGTSQATALVVGVLAALCMVTGASATQARRALLQTVRPCRADADRCLRGLIDPLAAWEWLRATSTSPSHKEQRPSPDAIGELTMDDHQQPLIDDDPTAGVAPSSCSCSAGAGANAEQPAPSKTYALGTLGFDYATEAHRDSLVQQGLGNPYDAATLAAFLVDHPSAATAVTFTLLQQQTPIYALQPAGAFAREGYARLVGLLATQAAEHVERMSFPGLAYGTTQLSSHQVVPVLFPEARGVFAWSTAELVQATVGEAPKPDDAEAHARHEEQLDGIRNFLERVYYDLRNLGQSSGDRALNFAATNAFQLGHVYGNAIDEGMVLDSISSSRSALSRPESDLWDVTIGFFDPKARLERAKAQYKFTVDVSYVVPVTVGRVRKFHSH